MIPCVAKEAFDFIPWLLTETCFELESTAVSDCLMVHGLKRTFDPKLVLRKLLMHNHVIALSKPLLSRIK